jgi:hypothetical protein
MLKLSALMLDNIKMDLTGSYCIYLAEGEVLWQAFVNTPMNTRIIGRQGI